MKKIIALLLLSLSLTGCIPAALVVGATAGGAIIYDQRNIKTVIQDRNSTQSTQNRINTDPYLKKAHIGVATFNHIMLLVGQAPTPGMRQRANQIALQAKNVQRVYNEIVIAKPISFARRSKDTLVTSAVKAAMLFEKGLHSTEIKAVTENGVVYLMGVISRTQAQLATNVVRRVDGVKKVVKVFQYTY